MGWWGQNWGMEEKHVYQKCVLHILADHVLFLLGICEQTIQKHHYYTHEYLACYVSK